MNRPSQYLSAIIVLFSIFNTPIYGQEKEQSVRPGINAKFLDKNLKVAAWLKLFEVESREIFEARDQIVAACEIEPGMNVADIGAGTGLYTRLFSNLVGDKGWVYAVEINPRWLEHILARAEQEKQTNISAVLCPENSISLAPSSIDKAFVCDTYHHFEYPVSTLASIYSALKPGGELIVIDFEKIEGVSREWVLGHVRAGKAVCRKEIESAGFELIEEVNIEDLKENYFLRFKKPNQAQTHSKEVTVAEAKALLAETNPPVIIDLRTPEEFEGGHITNAISIDFLNKDFDTNIAKLDRNKPYLIHCKSGGRSSRALERFKAQGFTNIYHLKSGWAGWSLKDD